MGKIVAIGGGEIGRSGYPIETMSIDKEIIALSGKVHPHLLFIPTASSDNESYADVVKRYFGKKLGCVVDTMYVYSHVTGKQAIVDQIASADIIYVGGGNTLKMMNKWRAMGVDVLLKRAYMRGVVMSGMSAGAICWFSHGVSDSRRFTDPEKQGDYITVTGLGIYPAMLCPHFNSGKKIQKDFQKMMNRREEIGIAVDECAAVEIVDDRYRIITSQSGKHGYRAYWKKGKYIVDPLTKSTSFRDIRGLLDQ